MNISYHSPSDTLGITLSPVRSAESEEVYEGFVFDFDVQGRVVGIEVDQASRRLDLASLQKHPGYVGSDDADPVAIYTVAMLAVQLGLTARAVQLTIKAMREAGIEVGSRFGSSNTTLLSSNDVTRIAQWRRAHPRGRPKRQTATS
ncbi:DUF2283 domain-containing protein [Candidatus Latescibacterota bacterium]